MQKKLICLGDSLTFGYGVRPSLRWTNVAAKETGWEIVNEGINGDTTGGMLARLQTKVLPMLRVGTFCANRPCVLLLGGTNDVFYSGTDIVARTNMGAMLHQLLAAGVFPMVGSPLPVDAGAPGAWAAVVDFSAAEECLKEYRGWLAHFCAVFGVPLVDFCADFLCPDGMICTELLLDGLHPTPEGHQIMARRLCAQLKKEQQG